VAHFVLWRQVFQPACFILKDIAPLHSQRWKRQKKYLCKMKLPKIIAYLIAARDKYDSKAFAANFSDDAIVHDEGKTYHCKTEIIQWNEMTNAKYKTKYEPLEDTTEENKITLTAKISGTFPGSPAIIKYHFETKNGKIISLHI
jgi:hypothetical protein